MNLIIRSALSENVPLMKSIIDCTGLLPFVETTGIEDFALTRKFYDKLGYKRVGLIPHFYCEGEDKVIFHKMLQ